jgi:hypothetical protein
MSGWEDERISGSENALRKLDGDVPTEAACRVSNQVPPIAEPNTPAVDTPFAHRPIR